MLEIHQNLLNQLLESFNDLPLVINENHCWTYAEFLNEANLLCNSLNIAPQKRIGLCSEDSEFLLQAMLALWMREAVAVPVNPKFPSTQKNELLKKIKCESTLSEDSLQAIRSSQVIRKLPPLNPEAWSTVFFTSGSNGYPKAVVHTLANHLFNALGANRIMLLEPGDRWLLSLPLFHVGGLAILFRTLLSGAALVISSKKKSLDENIEKNQITHLSLVPTQLYRLLQSEKGKKSLQKLKLILLGGSAIPEPLLEQSVKLGLNLQTTYGSTEMASQIATSHPLKTKKGWVAAGKVLPFREVRISSQNEIELRGKTLFCGYLTESGFQRPFDDRGWFAGGDSGYWEFSEKEKNDRKIIDEKNATNSKTASKSDYLIVTGRMDSMFISGGENIHPEEIEGCLLQFPNTEQAAVVAVKDTEFGQRPVAFVKSSVNVSESEMRKFLENRLQSFKVPELFLPWPELTPAGLKPSRNELTNIAQSHFDLWQKENLNSAQQPSLDFENWLKQFPLGWLPIAVSNGRQVFKVIDYRNKYKSRCLYVLASSRQAVMEWLLASENRNLLEEQNEENQKIKWFNAADTKRKAARDSIEIIRILEDELPENKYFMYDAGDRGEFKTFCLPEKKMSNEPITSAKEFSSDQMYMNYFLTEFNTGWEWKFPEAVFQFGICLPEYNRMYLLRCLYRRIDSAKKFLGWKVQLLREFSKSENHENPFWEISLEEENSLEAWLQQSGLFNTDDYLQANTPQKERTRRAAFQSQIDNLFDK
ncbi:MAG: 2-succinylbenzoate--CoA ligase [Deltaproteobacteria bacterium]|jgi:O-succinylbenzoic acid--CoA ligase|nr:2-succinylbenzoate--CoA ligase [Deltaproteobacteria bacterium]